MKNVISFSGGRTSALMVKLLLNKDPDAEVVFMDTGAEHPKTYEFIRNIHKHWGINITCLRVIPNPQMRKPSTYITIGVDDIGPDLEPWRLMLRKYGHPYVGGAFCTDRMKTTPFKKYCEEKYGRGNFMTWLGIRADEPRRLNQKPGIKFLAEICSFGKQDVIDWWSKQPFDLGIPEHLGNCVFCIKKSVKKVALATKDEPELANQFVDMLYGELWNRKGQPIMYRGNNSLKMIIDTYDGMGRNTLAETMRSVTDLDVDADSSLCSDSCEVIRLSETEAGEPSFTRHESGSISIEFENRDFFASLSFGVYSVSEIVPAGMINLGRVTSEEAVLRCVVDFVRSDA